MSNQNDAFARSVALEKAVSIAHIIGQDQIMEYAEKFRAFIAGEMAEVAQRPTWVYFRYRNSKTIYYRSDLNKHATDSRGVQRKSHAAGEWTSWSWPEPQTRAELRERKDEYVFVPRSQVPEAYLR